MHSHRLRCVWYTLTNIGGKTNNMIAGVQWGGHNGMLCFLNTVWYLFSFPFLNLSGKGKKNSDSAGKEINLVCLKYLLRQIHFILYICIFFSKFIWH